MYQVAECQKNKLKLGITVLKGRQLPRFPNILDHPFHEPEIAQFGNTEALSLVDDHENNILLIQVARFQLAIPQKVMAVIVPSELHLLVVVSIQVFLRGLDVIL